MSSQNLSRRFLLAVAPVIAAAALPISQPAAALPAQICAPAADPIYAAINAHRKSDRAARRFSMKLDDAEIAAGANTAHAPILSSFGATTILAARRSTLPARDFWKSRVPIQKQSKPSIKLLRRVKSQASAPALNGISAPASLHFEEKRTLHGELAGAPPYG